MLVQACARRLIARRVVEGKRRQLKIDSLAERARKRQAAVAVQRKERERQVRVARLRARKHATMHA